MDSQVAHVSADIIAKPKTIYSMETKEEIIIGIVLFFVSILLLAFSASAREKIDKSVEDWPYKPKFIFYDFVFVICAVAGAVAFSLSAPVYLILAILSS